MLHAVSRRQGLPMAAKQPTRLQTFGPIEGKTGPREPTLKADEHTCVGPQVPVSLE
jgi:hypothetical protein